MSLDNNPEPSSRGRQRDTSHRVHESSSISTREGNENRHWAQQLPSSTTTTDARDDDKRHQSRHSHRRHGNYDNSIHPLAYVAQEVRNEIPLHHNLRRHRDPQQGSDPHSHGRSHRRRHRRPHHGERHRSLAGDDQGRATMTTTMKPPVQSGSDGSKLGDDTADDQITSTQVDGGRSEGGGGGEDFDMAHHFPFVYQRENITFEHVKMEQDRRKKLEESNHESISSLANLSIDFTRRLDTTYYNLLETATNLRSAINSFQDLTRLASDVRTTFNRESSELEQDHKKQITEFNGFKAQIRRVGALEGRMQNCREKGRALDKRLETVRGKIDSWDRREEEWQARVSRRLRILWGIMGTLALVIATLRFFEQIRPDPSVRTTGPDAPPSAEKSVGNLSFLSSNLHSSVTGNVDDKEQWIRPSRHLALEEGRESSCRAPIEPATETSPRFQQESDDPLQRVIDEL